MKTVSGKVHSSKPISLSKAASTLSTFISTENGASQALCAYLRRASDSFNELKQLHKELRVHGRHKSGDNSGGGGVADYRSRSAVSQAFDHRDENTKKKGSSHVEKEDLHKQSEGEVSGFIEEGLHRRIENEPGRSIKPEGDVVYLDKDSEAKESGRKKSKRKREVDFNEVGRHNDKNETEFRNTMSNVGEFRKRRDDSEVKSSSTEFRAQIVEPSQEQVQGVQHNAVPEREGTTHKKRRRSKSSFNDWEVEKDQNGGTVDQGRSEIEPSQEQVQGVQHNAVPEREGTTHKKRRRSKSSFNDWEVEKDQNGGTVDQGRSEIEAKDKENKKNDYMMFQENTISDSMEQQPKKKKKKEHIAD